MDKLTMKGAATVWDRSALGTPAGRSHLGLNFAGAPSTAQLRIGWQVVFMDAVEKLGGSAPVYIPVDTKDITFQRGVSFSLPLNRGRTAFKDIFVVGNKCSTVYEAESEAAVAALQELQHGCLRMRVMDVSGIRAKELKNMCYELLSNAWQAYHAAKSVLSYWENCMDHIELCYSPPRFGVDDHMLDTAGWQQSDIRRDIADQLAQMLSSYYLKLKEYAAEAEEAESYINAIHERINYFFCEPPSNEANEHRGSLPAEIELSTKLILQAMIIALGWQWPTLKANHSQPHHFVCEISLLPNHVHIGSPPKALVITGPQCLSEEEAIEKSCSSAISALEREKSICLVDLNYNHRSHAILVFWYWSGNNLATQKELSL